MATTWELLISGSALPDNPANTAWDHINNPDPETILVTQSLNSNIVNKIETERKTPALSSNIRA